MIKITCNLVIKLNDLKKLFVNKKNNVIMINKNILL